MSMAASAAVMALAWLGASCTAPKDPMPTEPTGEAMFDDLTYVGNDSYYAEHPLAGESEFYNPILPGFFSDPAICSNGKGDYYLVTSTFTYFPGVPIFHSRDLVNWRQIGHVLSRESQLVNMVGQHVSGGIFAPGLSYNPKTGTYYMITTNVGAGNFYVKTQDPAGPWSDPIYVHSVRGIDPSIFIDDDGKAYVVNNDDAPNDKPEYPGHRTVRLQELDLATDQMVGERRILINKGCRPEEKPIWCEGPHIYKINGYYYLMTAEGGTGDWHSEVIYRSKSVWGPYEAYKGNPILTQRTLDNNRPDPITCAGHADLVQAQEGDWWAVFLACRPVKDNFENLGRETFMLPVMWTNDGWPLICNNNEIVSRTIRREGVKPEHREGGDNWVGNGNFGMQFDFDAEQLPLQFMTLRTSGADKYSLTKRPGWLTLKEDTIDLSDKDTPSAVFVRPQHHRYTCRTRMQYVAGSETSQAGLTLFKDETHYLKLCATQGKLQLLKMTPEACTALDEQPLQQGEVELRVESNGLQFTFSYSLNRGKDWKTIGEAQPTAFLSTRDAGGFTGTMIGLFAKK